MKENPTYIGYSPRCVLNIFVWFTGRHMSYLSDHSVNVCSRVPENAENSGLGRLYD